MRTYYESDTVIRLTHISCDVCKVVIENFTYNMVSILLDDRTCEADMCHSCHKKFIKHIEDFQLEFVMDEE